MSEIPTFSRPVDLSAVQSAGLERSIIAEAAERAAIGEAYDIPEVRALAAEFVVAREPKGVIRVRGRVTADIVQSCVVSLEPVEQAIDEEVDVRMVEAGSRGVEPPRPGAEVMIDPDEPDPPDVIAGPTLDLGALALEHFLLAVDPYPRAPGAALPADITEPASEAADSPFAVLAQLRERKG